MTSAWRSISRRYARSANKSFARLYKGGGVQGQRPCPRSAERGILFMLTKDQEGGLRGKPYQGVSPFFFTFVRVRRYAGWFSLACPAIRPHFFGACPKKRCRAAKEKRFFYLGGSTSRVSASASVVVTHLRPTWGGAWWVSGDWCGCAVLLGGSLWPLLPVPPHFFALAQRNGVEPQRNALMGAATGAVGSRPPLPRTRSPNITADCVKLT